MVGEDDADSGENTHDDVDDDTDRQQLVNAPVSWWSRTCTQSDPPPLPRNILVASQRLPR